LRSVSIANNSREAYTGNTVGRRGDVPPQSNSAPLVEKKQLATVLTCRKPVHRDRFGEILRDCRGPRAWHVVREASGTWEVLNLPPIEGLEVGRNQPQEEWPTGLRKSDHLIVLRDGRAVHMGKGMTVLCSSQREHMQIRQADKHMQTSLRGIAKRAKEDPKHRFGNLYSLLNEKNLTECFPQLNRKAAPGVDAVDWTAFEADLQENVSQLATALKEKRYKAKLVRRRNIPKPGGKQRPLGIPVICDKLVQTAAAQILSAIYEQDFLPCSHGYRRGKGAPSGRPSN